MKLYNLNDYKRKKNCALLVYAAFKVANVASYDFVSDNIFIYDYYNIETISVTRCPQLHV